MAVVLGAFIAAQAISALVFLVAGGSLSDLIDPFSSGCHF